MFTQAICLTHYSDEFIARLEAVGYVKSVFSTTRHATRDDFCILTSVVQGKAEYIVLHKSEALSDDPRVSWTNLSAHRYITDNETIAWGLACLRDSGDDRYRFFTIDCNFQFDGKDPLEKGTLVFCTRDNWNLDFDNEGNPYPFSSRNVPAHKSTKEEIINYFSKKN